LEIFEVLLIEGLVELPIIHHEANRMKKIVLLIVEEFLEVSEIPFLHHPVNHWQFKFLFLLILSKMCEYFFNLLKIFCLP
jgi:hypothetical protein